MSSNKKSSKTKSSTPPSDFMRIGHVYMNPADLIERFPSAIFTENPATFVAGSGIQEGVRRVFQWGLYLAEIEGADLSEQVRMRMMTYNFNMVYYSDYPSPMSQFLSVLMKRKEAKIASDPQILDAVANKSLTVRVSLTLSEADCWRIVRFPASTSLAVLHDQILGPVMGWCRGYHGYVFEDLIDGAAFGPKDNAGYIDMMHVPMDYHEIMDDRKIPIAALLREVGDKCVYNYDIGDNWRHNLEVIGVSDVDGGVSVEIVDGSGACPPEDGNGLLKGTGPFAYANFLREVKQNPTAPKVLRAIHEIETTAKNYTSHWLTGASVKYHPFKYDITLHRCTVDKMISGPRIQKPSGDFTMNTFKENHNRCAQCSDRLKPLMTCSVCKTEKYCSRECQKEHWKFHKSLCKVIAAAAADTANK